MCAMLALVVPQELKITKSRISRFVEAYIGSSTCFLLLLSYFILMEYPEVLSRLRLHTCAAYIRKFVPVEDIRATTSVREMSTCVVDDDCSLPTTTQLQTTIYTACGKCRRPLVLPAGPMLHAGKPSGSFSLCKGCRASITKCSIW